MKRECVACQQFGMKSHPQHAALGYGRCASYPVATFVHIKRNLPCAMFKPAPEAKVAARRTWWIKRCEADT